MITDRAEPPRGVFAGVSPPGPLWGHQQRALQAFAADRRRREAVDVPGGPAGRRQDPDRPGVRPGGGPAHRWCCARTPRSRPSGSRSGRPRFAPPAQSAGHGQPRAADAADRADLPGGGRLAPVGTRPRRAGRPAGLSRTSSLLDEPAPERAGAARAAQGGGPWTLVLDECHHLLETWGRLLLAIVAELPGPRVVGLTATPPHLMTAEQAELHRELFGAVDLEVSAPALVRDGHLAPYQELAWFTAPTPAEADYIGGQALRFAELRAGTARPGIRQRALPGLAAAAGGGAAGGGAGDGAQLSWERFARDEPALADAALRLHCDGLLPLPEGAAVREQHRHPPSAADWVALIGDYCQRCLLASGDGGRPGGPRGDQPRAPVDRLPADPGRRAGGGVPGRPGAGPVGEQGRGGRRDPARRGRPSSAPGCGRWC